MMFPFRFTRRHYVYDLNNVRSITTTLAQSIGQEEIFPIKKSLNSKGYAPSSFRILDTNECVSIRESIMPALFRGSFETGIYPDEWHWRYAPLYSSKYTSPLA